MFVRFPDRSFLTRSLLVLALGGAFLHCAHPTDDYEKYLEIVKTRTSSNPPPATCLGTPVTTDVDISGVYVGYCRVNFADASQALRLATRFTKKVDSIEAKMVPLKVGATTVNDTVGDPEVSASGTILGGTFKMEVGTVKISGAANPISGSDIQLDGATFDFVINSKDEILAELDGQLVKPFTLDISDKSKSDICVFLRLADDVTLPQTPPGDKELSCRIESDGGTGGSDGGGEAGPCTDDGTLYCGKSLCELPPISSCDAETPSACAVAMCATTTPLDCKKALTDCEADEKCNKAISCGSVCLAQDPNADTVTICGPIAGLSIGKALAYKNCAGKLTACGGDGMYDPPAP